MHSLDALLHGVLEHEWHCTTGHGNYHVVDRLRDLHEALEVGNAHLLDAYDVVGVDLHGVERSLEVAHVAEPDVVVELPGPNHGDDFRTEGCVQLLLENRHRHLHICNARTEDRRVPE